jgi:hypothetical protein
MIHRRWSEARVLAPLPIEARPEIPEIHSAKTPSGSKAPVLVRRSVERRDGFVASTLPNVSFKGNRTN